MYSEGASGCVSCTHPRTSRISPLPRFCGSPVEYRVECRSSRTSPWARRVRTRSGGASNHETTRPRRRVLKTLQRRLTMFNGKSVRFGSPMSGRDFPLRPDRTFLPACPRLSGISLTPPSPHPQNSPQDTRSAYPQHSTGHLGVEFGSSRGSGAVASYRISMTYCSRSIKNWPREVCTGTHEFGSVFQYICVQRR